MNINLALDRIHKASHIFFDVGGTLLRPFPSPGEIYAREFFLFGYSFDSQELQDRFNVTWEKFQIQPKQEISSSDYEWWYKFLKDMMKNEIKEADFDQIYDHLWIAFASPKNWQEIDGAFQLLKNLQQNGKRLHILSNWDERLRSIIRELNIASYFESITLSSDYMIDKPDKKLFDFALKNGKCDRSEVLYIGDSYSHDAVGCQNAGWDFILVNNTKYTNLKIGDLKLNVI